jgi:hypothetical protein
MEGANRRLKEVKFAKRSVETGIRMFGASNITSILDRDTFSKRLGEITTKLEMYMDKSEEVIEELEELKDLNDEAEGEFDTMIDEINNLTDDIIKKVNDNEHQVKKKIEQVIAEHEDNTGTIQDSTSESESRFIPESTEILEDKSCTKEHHLEANEPDQNIVEDLTEKETAKRNSATADFVKSFESLFPLDRKSKAAIDQVADVVTAAEAIPGMDKLRPNVTNVVNNVLPVVKEFESLFRLFKK